MARAKDATTAAERRELVRDITLVQATEALRKHKTSAAPQKMLIPVEQAAQTEDKMVE
jgi:hypothetical protein